MGSFDEAVAVARQCPALDHGTAVEVRQVAASCAARGRAAGQPRTHTLLALMLLNASRLPARSLD